MPYDNCIHWNASDFVTETKEQPGVLMIML